MEEGEKNSIRTWNHRAGRIVNHVETFIRRSQKSQWKENHTVATLWKPIRSGLDRFFPGSFLRKPITIIYSRGQTEAVDPSLKSLARQGSISFTKHKRPISIEDLKVLYAAVQLRLNNPESLADSAWFNTILIRKERPSTQSCSVGRE